MLDPKMVVNSPAWLEWFQRMSDYYETVSRWIDAGGIGGFGAHEPSPKFEGLLAYADGIGWDPGSGQGYYRYRGGVWVPVGGQGPSNTVVSAVAFGLLPIVGIQLTYSRGDHSHGTPIDPIPAHLAAPDPHPQYTLDTVFDNHHVQHENGGTDEISVAGLSGSLADPQVPVIHHTRHENGGDDEISVAGLSGELADQQKPKVAGSDTDVQFNDGGVIGGAGSIRYNKGTGVTQLGGASDYTEIEADGTIRNNGNATTWNDINLPGLALGTGPVAPAIIAISTTGIRIYAFIGTGVNPDELHGSLETLHDYLEGSDIVAHVHWMPSTNDVGNVKWQLEYIWMSRTGTVSGSTTISVTTAAGGTAWTAKRSDFPTISGTGRVIGDRFIFRIFRDPADAADTYTHDAGLLDFGLHYDRDTMGSRGIATK